MAGPFGDRSKWARAPASSPTGPRPQHRPTGQTACSEAPNRRKSETPIPQVQAQEAPREARRLLHLAVRPEGFRLSPIRSRGEGRLAHWARWDRGPLGLDAGPRAHVD
eukprot:4501690-Alexandrium_andersonii.AAC.1